MVQKDFLYEGVTAQAKEDLIKNYQKAFKNIKAQLGDLYSKYEKLGELTYAEMARFNQLQGIQDGITKEIKALTHVNKRKIRETSVKSYIEGHFNEAWKVEQKLKVNLQYGLINPNTIITSVNAKIDKLTLNQRLEKQRARLTIDIRNGITQGLIQGESYGEMAKRVKGSLENDLSKSIKVVNTEAHRTMSDGRMASLRISAEAGVGMKKVWVSTLDMMTRDTHKALDGQKKNLEEAFTSRGLTADSPGNFGIAREDINCRCSVRGEIVGYEPTERAARDLESGKTIITKQQTYRQWMEGKFEQEHIDFIDKLIGNTVTKIEKIEEIAVTSTLAKVVTKEFNKNDFIIELNSMYEQNPKDYYKKIMQQVENDIQENLGIDTQVMNVPTKVYVGEIKEGNLGKGYKEEYKIIKIRQDDGDWKGADVPKELWHYVDKFNKAKSYDEQLTIIRKIQEDMGPSLDKINKNNQNKKFDYDKLAKTLEKAIIKKKELYVNIETLWEPDTSKSKKEIASLSYDSRPGGLFINKQTTIEVTGPMKTRTNFINRWLVDHIDARWCPQKDSIPLNALKARSRAFENSSKGVFIPTDSNTSTIAHETGHWLHDNNKQCQRLVNEFWYKRVQNYDNTVMYRYKNDNGNIVEEKGVKDKFIDHYIGRVYGWEGSQKGMEVVSMGIQLMYEDPTNFYIKDPEHFKLIYALMKGWF